MKNNDLDENLPPLTIFMQKALKTGIDNKAIQQNSLVVTKYDLPDLGIFADQTYELKSIYLQGKNIVGSNESGSNSGGNSNGNSNSNSNSNSNGEVEKIILSELDLTQESIPGYTLYIALYSQNYHNNDKFSGRPVIVTPAEVGLVSMKDEVLDSVLVAIPILSFWLGLCFVFATKYNERYGGNFMDAFFGK